MVGASLKVSLVFHVFSTCVELFVYIITITSLVNQTVRARPIAVNSFVLAAPGFKRGGRDKW